MSAAAPRGAPLSLLGPLPTADGDGAAAVQGFAAASLAPGPVPTAPGEPRLTALYDAAPVNGLVPGVRVQANMVTTVDGRVTGSDGLSGTISSRADKRVFSVLRGLASAVVVGAGTARAERYTRLSPKPAYAAARAARGQADVPVLVVVTNSGTVDIDRLNSAGTSPVVVHAGAAASAARLADLRAAFGAEAVVTHPGDAEPRAVLSDLARRGLTRVLTEGGPTLLGRWLAAGAVDELCLTVSPLLAGPPVGDGPPSLTGALPLPGTVATTVRSVLTDGATLIYRLGLDAASFRRPAG